MKITLVLSIMCLLLLFFASSCTVEKRVHLKGYHIEWNGGNKNSTNPIMVKKEKIKDDQQVVALTDSVGTLIKNAIAEKNTVNQDSILDVIGKLMTSSSEINELQANVNSDPNLRTSSQHSFASTLSKQLEKMQNSTSFYWNTQANDTTEKDPKYVETSIKRRNSYSTKSRGQNLGNWSLALFLGSLIIYPLIVAVPFVAIAGIVHSNREINDPETDQMTEIIREKARKGRAMSIVTLSIWGFFVLLAATIIAYTISPVP